MHHQRGAVATRPQGHWQTKAITDIYFLLTKGCQQFGMDLVLIMTDIMVDTCGDYKLK